jgi:hypothetical protein
METPYSYTILELKGTETRKLVRHCIYQEILELEETEVVKLYKLCVIIYLKSEIGKYL